MNPVIAVYDATSFQFIRGITVTGGFGFLSGMAFSPNNDYLYVTDYVQNVVFKVPLSSGAQSNWGVDPNPRGIAINRQNNLLVASESQTIKEYTSVGGFVRTIAVASVFAGVRVLSNGNLAITRRGPKYGVAVLLNDGSEQYSYGSTTRGSAAGQMYSPYGITGNSQDYLLVTDQDNNRVVVLNPTLSEARDLSLPISGGLGPYSIWLDESRGVLFVSEFGSVRVLVFSYVNAYNLASAFAA